VFVLRDEEFLYVAGIGDVACILTVYIAQEDSVRVLHASYALGEGAYALQGGDVYELDHGFEDWARPMDGDGHVEHTQSHGWSASTIELGERTHMEMMILIGELGDDARIAVSLAREPEFEAPLVLPEGLEDDTALGEIQRGPLPAGARFDTEYWIALNQIEKSE
jgi:hypothetical protein